MIKEEKQLLLIDLCGRVPYHPKGKVVNNRTGAECDEWLTCATFNMFTNISNNSRLYLRPMESMTEEEKREYDEICNISFGYPEIGIQMSPISNVGLSWNTVSHLLDWLNKKMFDYRGLIKLGIAIEAPKGMYGKEEEK